MMFSAALDGDMYGYLISELIKKGEEKMNSEFKVHLLNDAGIFKAKEIAEAFDAFLEHLKDLCPEGREFSIVKTKLEEASFFAKKSMAIDAGNQK